MPNDGQWKVEPFALGIVVLLYAEHLLFGGDNNYLGLVFAIVHLTILAVLIAVSRGAQPPRLPLTAPAILLGAVFVLGLFSVLPLGPPLAHPLWSYVPHAPASISLDPVTTRMELIKLAGLTALFLIGAGFGSRRETAERFALYLAYGGIAYCAWVFLVWVVHPGVMFGVPLSYGSGRLTGSFLGPNTAGTLFASLAAMSLVSLLRPVMRARRAQERWRLDEILDLWPWALLLLLALSCLLLSASRGALLALAAAIIVSLGYLIWIKGSQRSLSAGFAAVICLLLFAGAVVILVSGDHTISRLAVTDPLNNDRLQLVAAYWPTFRASPWLGYGLGAFDAINDVSMTRQNALLLSHMDSVHNVYLQWLLWMGVPGAVAMVGCVAAIVIAIARGTARRSGQQALGAACLAVAAVFAVHGLTDYALDVPSMAAFFAVILGLGYGISQRPASGRTSRSSGRKPT